MTKQVPRGPLGRQWPLQEHSLASLMAKVAFELQRESLNITPASGSWKDTGFGTRRSNLSTETIFLTMWP